MSQFARLENGTFVSAADYSTPSTGCKAATRSAQQWGFAVMLPWLVVVLIAVTPQVASAAQDDGPPVADHAETFLAQASKSDKPFFMWIFLRRLPRIVRRIKRQVVPGR
jgi:hypothetical protein